MALRDRLPPDEARKLEQSLSQTDWGIAAHKGVRNFDLTDDEATALHAYSIIGGPIGARSINDALRSGALPLAILLKFASQVATSGAKKLPIIKDRLFRHISYLPRSLVTKTPGDRFTEAGFLSTTLDDALLGPHFKHMPHVMLIMKSQNSRDLRSLSLYNQGEVIFAPGTTFEITSRFDVDGASTFEMEEV